jgi:hypothetical protein
MEESLNNKVFISEMIGNNINSALIHFILVESLD